MGSQGSEDLWQVGGGRTGAGEVVAGRLGGPIFVYDKLGRKTGE